MFINFFGGLLDVLSFPIASFNGVDITYLHLMLVCVIIPIVFSFIKSSNNDRNLIHNSINSLKSKTNRSMAYNNYTYIFNNKR
jgi:ABC-type glycerol-3-phosphate transport system permease component